MNIYRKKAKKVLVLSCLFIILYLQPIIINSVNFIHYNNGNVEKSKEAINENPLSDEEDNFLLEDLNFESPIFNESCIVEWKRTTKKADQNLNGINDNFEDKLAQISTSVISKKLQKLTKEDIIDSSFGNKKPKSKDINSEAVPIVLSFPRGDITTIISLFQDLGGSIKNRYDKAINGFAGSINIEKLNQFSNILNDQNVPFIIEEDSYFSSCNYYVSRNMNLRPYVWNTLSYDGDNSSAVAVIDTGIDDSHSFFSPGYSSGNYNYKIVGWRNEVGAGGPLDDNGHGSHCGGIIAGNGTACLDNKNRTIATYSFGEDWTGYTTPEWTISNIYTSSFNVTVPGTIYINYTFSDTTPGSDDVDVYVYLYRGTTQVDSYITTSNSWTTTLTYTATQSTLGEYNTRMTLMYDDQTGDGWCDEPRWGIRAVHQIPFNATDLTCGDLWKGVAPDARLVGVKVLDNEGSGSLSDIVDGVNWAITNKNTYNITVISMSLGGSSGETSLINAVNNAVENGIVTVVAAGNDGAPGPNIGSPGDADNVITVAAMNINDNITEYSSSGGPSYTGYTNKPDITAPGGSDYNYWMFSVDSNDNDASGRLSDGYSDDMAPMLGTSMATPAVAGAANLLIEAMGGSANWNYTAVEAKRVKALLLATATETYPLTREITTDESPLLNRGGKDIHEGYGRLNIDAALEAYTQELALGAKKSAWLSSSLINPFKKHALGCHVNLINGENYKFSLSVPAGADFDLHLYNNSGSSYGEPIMLASSTSSIIGENDDIYFTPTKSGKYYLVVKAISGEGYANISCKINALPPILNSESVSPLKASQSTLFNFSVIYTDLDDFSPVSINVSINGTSFPMVKHNPSDINYTDGCLYKYLTYLQPAAFNYTYLFECSDRKFFDSTITYDNLQVILVNNYEPELLNPQVSPKIGGNSTLFNFTVWYFDDDNNFPGNINITLNTMTTYLMLPVNPLDTNAMDGVLYYFNITLDFGFHSFQINCTDGIFTNSTGWIIGPEVNPFYNLFFSSQKIIINEICANPDFIEMYNYGSDRDMTGWYIIVYDNNAIDIIYNFPNGWIFKSKFVVVLHEYSGTDTDTELYTGVNIWWTSDPIAAGLFDNTGANIDWVQTSDHTLPRPPDAEWTQDVSWTISNNYAYRTSDIDNNLASDWTVASSGTQGSLNPGQTGGRLFNLLLPLYNSFHNCGVVIVFSWKSLDAFFGACIYTLQISNSPDFSSISIERSNILEIPIETSVSISVQLPEGKYYWRIRAKYDIFMSNWSNSFTFNLLAITTDDDDDEDDDDDDWDEDRIDPALGILIMTITLIIVGIVVISILTVVVIKKRKSTYKPRQSTYKPSIQEKKLPESAWFKKPHEKSLIAPYRSPYKSPESKLDVKFCTNCGSKIDKGDNFCTNCGASSESKLDSKSQFDMGMRPGVDQDKMRLRLKDFILNKTPPPKSQFSPEGQRATMIAKMANDKIIEGKLIEALNLMLEALRLGVPEPFNTRIKATLLELLERNF